MDTLQTWSWFIQRSIKTDFASDWYDRDSSTTIHRIKLKQFFSKLVFQCLEDAVNLTVRISLSYIFVIPTYNKEICKHQKLYITATVLIKLQISERKKFPSVQVEFKHRMANHVLCSSNKTQPMVHFDWLEPVSSVGYVPQKYQFLSNLFSSITQSPEITFVNTLCWNVVSRLNWSTTTDELSVPTYSTSREHEMHCPAWEMNSTLCWPRASRLNWSHDHWRVHCT